MKTKTLTFALLCALAALLAPVAHAADENEDLDIIERNDNVKTPQTKIVQDNYIAVIGKHRIEVKVPAYAVKDVYYAGRSPNYSAAIEKRGEGRFTTAALYFTRALADMEKEKWAVEYCNYGIGDALYQSGNFGGYKGKSGTQYDSPVAYFEKVLQANPKSRFLPEILVRIPVCLSEDGKLDQAEQKLAEAEAQIKKYRDEVIKVDSKFLEIADRATAQLAISDARIAEKKAEKGGKYDDAKNKYLSARFKSTKFPELMGEAVDGLMRVLILMKDYRGAESEANSIIRKYKQEGDPKMIPLLPAAYSTLGKANYAQAVDYGTKGQKIQEQRAYAESRWNFLNVIAQFGENDDYVAAAHFFSGVCSDKLRDLEPEAGIRAVRHFQTIVDDFPKSQFKDNAMEELKRLGVKVEDPDAKKPETKKPAPATGKAPAKAAPKK
jgi:tetratricopeptide (TPR) repeat protein